MHLRARNVRRPFDKSRPRGAATLIASYGRPAALRYSPSTSEYVLPILLSNDAFSSVHVIQCHFILVVTLDAPKKVLRTKSRTPNSQGRTLPKVKHAKHGVSIVTGASAPFFYRTVCGQNSEMHSERTRAGYKVAKTTDGVAATVHVQRAAGRAFNFMGRHRLGRQLTHPSSPDRPPTVGATAAATSNLALRSRERPGKPRAKCIFFSFSFSFSLALRPAWCR